MFYVNITYLNQRPKTKINIININIVWFVCILFDAEHIAVSKQRTGGIVRHIIFFPGQIFELVSSNLTRERPFGGHTVWYLEIRMGVILGCSGIIAVRNIVDDDHFGEHDFDYHMRCWPIDIIDSIVF